MKPISSLVLVVALVCASPAFAADAKVIGKVALAGKPLTGGRIFFHLRGGEFVGCHLKPDGTFSISRIPAGDYKVTFEGKLIPRSYSAADTTPIAVRLKAGSHDFSFELKP